nr:unnamed protein product [Spirometra erinaceieuropaei]
MESPASTTMASPQTPPPLADLRWAPSPADQNLPASYVNIGTWMHPLSRRWQLLYYGLVRRHDPQAVLVTKTICEADGWMDHPLVISRWSKIQRHNKTPIGTFLGPGERFSHVHLDIVGPLPLSNGCSYLLTCVDRFTRRPEAIPLPDVATPTVVKVFLSRWVAIFGAPSIITTDRGAQFESHLSQSLLSFLGCTRIRTTAYHPAAKGTVKRIYRQLKASLRAAADPENWTDQLPLVLLGIRSSLKPDLDCSAAELVFGATVRLPGEMISPTPQGAVEDPTNLLHRLRQFMRTLSPVPPRSSASPSYLEKDLATCSHVYLRCDRVRRPLEPPHDGPFRVISRGTKNFRIQRGTREEVVSVDRLKAAVPDTPPDELCGPLPPAPPPRPSIPPSRIHPLPSCPQLQTATTPSSTNNTVTASHTHSNPVPPVYITRSGRHVHFPDRMVTHGF